MLLYAIAFLAGIVTAISPCVYPVLPIIFAGGASGGRRRPYAIIAGLVTSFATFTLIATWLLRQLHLPQDFLRNLSIGLLFLVAASLIFPRVGMWIGPPKALDCPNPMSSSSTTRGRRAVPTPGSTMTMCTVPEGK